MIGIKVISNTSFRTFELSLEELLAEHPDAKVIFGAIKGIEGGKGLVVVFQYEKKDEPKPVPVEVIPEPEPRPTPAEIERAKKKAELEKLKAELGE